MEGKGKKDGGWDRLGILERSLELRIGRLGMME